MYFLVTQGDLFDPNLFDPNDLFGVYSRLKKSIIRTESIIRSKVQVKMRKLIVLSY